VRDELRRQGVDKEIITSDGTCLVHEQFTPADIAAARAQFPGLRVVVHPECTPEVVAAADFTGSTGAMMRYVRATPEEPARRFIGGCRLCPYMKLNSLEKLRDLLRAPRPDQIVEVPEDVRRRAARCLDRMFELSPAD
ncbi:MAG: Quinolinate synthase, partial [Verrucomicrobiota bacterium]